MAKRGWSTLDYDDIIDKTLGFSAIRGWSASKLPCDILSMVKLHTVF